MSSPPLREIAAYFGIEFDDGNLRKGMQSVEGGVGLLREFGSVIAGAELVVGIREFADEFSDAAGAVKDSADRLGLSYREFQELSFAAKLGGVSAESLASALGKLNQQLGSGNGGRAAETLRRLGVSAKDANGQTRSSGDIMNDVAAAMSGIEDPAQRTAIATQLFGKSGAKLLTILQDGEGGLAELRGQLEELGGAMSDEAIAAADDYGDAMDKWNTTLVSVRSTIAVSLLPLLTEFLGWITKGASQFSRLTRGTHLAEGALKLLGIAGAVAGAKLLVAWLPVLAPILGVLAVLAALVIGYDELTTMIEGGDSALGRYLDRTYGVGTQQNVVRALGEAWDGAKLAFSDAGAAASRLWADIQAGVTGAWGAVTSFTGGLLAPFAKAWNAVDDATGGALTAILTKVKEYGSMIADTILAPFKAVGRMLSGGLEGLARDWRELVLNVPTTPRPASPGSRAASASAPQTVEARFQASPTTINRSVGPTTINVNGAGDPRRIAEAVTRELASRQRADLEADHPSPHPD